MLLNHIYFIESLTIKGKQSTNSLEYASQIISDGNVYDTVVTRAALKAFSLFFDIELCLVENSKFLEIMF